MPLSALSGMSGAGRAGARAGPTGGLDGRRGLVKLDDGSWGLLAQGWLLSEASDQRACVLVMPAREGEGKVRCELGLSAE
jgi:hypothetical protein